VATVMTGTRNRGIWEKLLPDIKEWLHLNPTASLSDAAKKFSVTPGPLKSWLDFTCPGEFDFQARRKARGDLNRKPKAPRLAAGTTDLRKELDAILEALSRIEGLLAKQDRDREQLSAL
jgi:hypothetical protein